MTAHDIWEGMVIVESDVAGTGPLPYHLEDTDKMIEFLDEESDTKALGRNVIQQEVDDEVFGTYIH